MVPPEHLHTRAGVAILAHKSHHLTSCLKSFSGLLAFRRNFSNSSEKHARPFVMDDCHPCSRRTPAIKNAFPPLTCPPTPPGRHSSSALLRNAFPLPACWVSSARPSRSPLCPALRPRGCPIWITSTNSSALWLPVGFGQ